MKCYILEAFLNLFLWGSRAHIPTPERYSLLPLWSRWQPFILLMVYRITNANSLRSSQNGAQHVGFSGWQNNSQLKAGLLWCFKKDKNFARSFSPANMTLNMLLNLSALRSLRFILLQSFLQLFLGLLVLLMRGYVPPNHI